MKYLTKTKMEICLGGSRCWDGKMTIKKKKKKKKKKRI